MTMQGNATNRFVERRDFTTSSSSGSLTDGEPVGRKYIPLDVVRIVAPVLEALARSHDAKLNREVIDLVEDIVGLLSQLARANMNMSNLPALHAANLDDGSFLIEWLSPNFRVGFVVEAEPKESMWYLITKIDSSDSSISGSLAGHERKASLGKLVTYVASNS